MNAKTNQHTPGPWEVCVTPPNDLWYAGVTIGAADPADGRRVCDLADCYLPMRDANGRLISAAPELLEILIRFEANAWDGDPRRRETDPDCIAARAAIAKATGK